MYNDKYERKKKKKSVEIELATTDERKGQKERKPKKKKNHEWIRKHEVVEKTTAYYDKQSTHKNSGTLCEQQNVAALNEIWEKKNEKQT